MRIHSPLDKILNSEIKVKVLRFLCRTDAEWSGRQIAKEIKVSPPSCHQALRELYEENILLLKGAGKSHLYRLNSENFLISELLKPLYERENKIPDEVYKGIVENISSLITSDIVSVVVFGSMRKKKERPTSDIDLLILVKNISDKEKVEENIGKVNEKIISKFGNTVSPYVQTIEEFKTKHKKGLPLIRNILKSHKLLFGKPLEELL